MGSKSRNKHFGIRAFVAAAWLTLTGSAMAAPPESAKAFSISAGTLNEALTEFADQANLKLVFDASLVQGLKARELAGKLTTRQGLDRLLDGSGLSYRFIGPDTAIVEPKPSQPVSPADHRSEGTHLPKVTVTGKAEYASDDPYNPDYHRREAVTATKTDTPIMETPMNVKVVPSQLIKDQQAFHLSKALENVSGVVADNASYAGGAGIRVFSRGFSNSDTYRNGLRAVTGTQAAGTADTANLERIEVLKGPASMLYGRIEPGGIVNLVTKQPLPMPYYSLQQQFGSYQYFRTMAEATGPITADDTLLYRFNFAYEDAGSFQDYRQNKTLFLAPVLRWNIAPRTQITFELEYRDAQDPVDFGIPAFGKRPLNVSRHFSYNIPGNVNDAQSRLAGFNWSHEFNDEWKVLGNFYQINTSLANRSVANAGFLNPASPFVLSRDSVNSRLLSDTYATTLNLVGHFDTFGLGHTLLLGGDYYSIDQKNPGKAAFYDDINVLTRVPIAVPPFPDLNAKFAIQEEWYGFYLQDQLKLPYGFQALAGFRYDHGTYRDTKTDLLPRSNPFFGSFDAHSADEAVTPRFGLLWQPIEELSLYGNYSENFGLPNLNIQTGRISRENLKPETAQQWEVGVKTELLDKRLTGTLSWFDLTKQNIAQPDPLHARSVVLVGEARNHGLEIDVAGELLPGWRMNLAGAYIDSAITRDLSGNEGNRLYNVPRFSGSVWNTYEWAEGLLRGLKVGGGIVGRSQTQGDNANSFQLPGFVNLNLMAGYSWKVGRSKVGLQFNIDNLLDKPYFLSSTGDPVIGAHYAAPRTFIGSVKVEF